MKKRPHFYVYRDKSKKWRWRLVAANGELVGPSQAYSRRADAVRATVRFGDIVMDADLVVQDEK